MASKQVRYLPRFHVGTSLLLLFEKIGARREKSPRRRAGY
jgi:hypothetical protein